MGTAGDRMVGTLWILGTAGTEWWGHGDSEVGASGDVGDNGDRVVGTWGQLGWGGNGEVGDTGHGIWGPWVYWGQ